jgi:hypothetical protein
MSEELKAAPAHFLGMHMLGQAARL